MVEQRGKDSENKYKVRNLFVVVILLKNINIKNVKNICLFLLKVRKNTSRLKEIVWKTP
jgi:hypothetical protein